MSNTQRKVPKKDHPLMMRRFRAGETYEAIASTYGVSRERVRQILNTHFGATRDKGGPQRFRFKRAKEKAAVLATARKERFSRLYGFTEKKVDSILELGSSCKWTKDARRLYQSQRNIAIYRGIGWCLTFNQWWMAWEKSGRWLRRGRRRNQFVLTRLDYGKPFQEGNILVTEFSDCVSRTRAYEKRFGLGIYSGKSSS